MNDATTTERNRETDVRLPALDAPEEAAPDVLAMAARVLGSDRPTWDSTVAVEPLLRLARRSTGARAAWLRVEGDLRVVAEGELRDDVREWVDEVSRLPAGVSLFNEEREDGLRAVGVPLNPEEGGESGSVGLVLGADAASVDHPGILRDLADVVRGELRLFRDVSTSAEALVALRVLGRAVANMQLGLTVTDAEGRIVYTNPAEAAMHGYRPDELIGKPGRILAPPTLRRAIELDVNRPHASWTRESVNRHRDGYDFPVLLWSDVIAAQDGGFRGVVTCSENLAPRRAMEAALRRSETMFRAVFDDAPVGLALVGHDTWIIRANPRLSSLLGLEEDTPSERRLLDFVHPDDLVAARSFYEAAMSDRAEVSRLEHRLGREESGYMWVNVSVSPIHDAAGREQLWIVLIEDTTKRRALEEQLRHSQKMEAVGRLAGGVAHDFNNLLTAIVGITELLMLEGGPDQSMADDLHEIHKAAVTASDLTRQLLAFSRRQITHHQLQDLNSIIRETEGMLRRLIGPDIEFIIDLASGPLPVMGDQGQIEQVVLNLLLNARDAVGEGGRVVLSTRDNSVPVVGKLDVAPGGTFVEISVADTGTGMDAATMEQIFDPFFTTKPKGRGTGLGLSTVYGIVKQSGGHIWVDSTVGKGSIFRVWLPRAETDRNGLPLFGPIRTILFLTEDESRRALITQTMQDAGFRVLTAEDARAAMNFAETYGDRIHALVVESNVGGVSGRELADRMRLLREDMKVIVLGPEPKFAHASDGASLRYSPSAEPEAVLECVERFLELEGRSA